MMLLYGLCYRIFFWLKRMKRHGGLWKKAAMNYEYYFTLLLNRKFIPWFEKHPVQYGLNTKPRAERYTVSLTSFPARINHVHIAIESLMRQSFLPDRIVLWLAESQFPDRKLPEKLTALQEKGLTIRFCEDLRSHKKYFYAFQEYPEDNIILTDDDAFYPRDMIRQLVRLHKKRPADIIGTTAQLVGPEITSLPTVWPAPQAGKRYFGSRQVQPFSGQGTLYPAKWYPQELLHKENAMKFAATADDLWLKAMSLSAGVKTSLVYPLRGFPVDIQIPGNQTLFSQNGNQGENLNDRVWKALVEAYQLDTLA